MAEEKKIKFHIVVEEGLGFGGGGWSSGYYIAVVFDGKVQKKFRASDKMVLDALKYGFDVSGIEHKIYTIKSGIGSSDKAKALVGVLKKSTVNL